MKTITLRNMAFVTIRRLRGGAVAVTGRKLGGNSRQNAGKPFTSRYAPQMSAARRRVVKALEKAEAQVDRLAAERRKYDFDLFAPGEKASRRKYESAVRNRNRLQERATALLWAEEARAAKGA